MTRQSRGRPWRPAVALFFAVLLAAPASGCAQGNGDPVNDPRFDQAVALFEAWLDAKMAYEKIPGVSAALVHNQDVVWARGYGYAHRETEVPATPSTMYSVCSISKLFTSIGVMQQRDEGKLHLDDPVSDHLPWYNLEQVYADGPSVSVEGILTHSSGLSRESAHPYWTGPDHPFPTADEIIEGLAEQETLYPGRRYFQYSNLGMALAGQLVEQASGMGYAEYIRSRILEPLGMSDTYPDIPVEHRGGRYATGYSRPRAGWHAGRGSLLPGVGDGVRSGVRLHRRGSGAPRLVAVPAAGERRNGDSRREHAAGDAPRALGGPRLRHDVGTGLRGRSARRERTVGHGGSCPGFRSTFQLIPAKKMAGAVMMNALANPTDVWTKMMATLGAALEEIRDDPGGGTVRPASLAEYEGLYQSTWGETVILRWDDGLAALGVPSNDPLEAMMRLRHEGGDTFRRVRDDGEPGEAYIFHRDDGAIARYSVHGNFSNRVR